MKVKELIAELSELDPDLLVVGDRGCQCCISHDEPWPRIEKNEGYYWDGSETVVAPVGSVWL